MTTKIRLNKVLDEGVLLGGTTKCPECSKNRVTTRSRYDRLIDADWITHFCANCEHEWVERKDYEMFES